MCDDLYIYIHINITFSVGMHESIMAHFVSSDNCFMFEVMVSMMYNIG
jgi:hypothetical protein